MLIVEMEMMSDVDTRGRWRECTYSSLFRVHIFIHIIVSFPAVMTPRSVMCYSMLHGIVRESRVYGSCMAESTCIQCIHKKRSTSSFAWGSGCELAAKGEFPHHRRITRLPFGHHAADRCYPKSLTTTSCRVKHAQSTLTNKHHYSVAGVATQNSLSKKVIRHDDLHTKDL